MLDLKALRRDPQPARTALARRADGSELRLDSVLELDQQRRELLPQVENLRAEQNDASEAIAKAKRAGDSAEQELARMQVVAKEAKQLKEKLGEVEQQLDELLALVPNPPAESAADSDSVLREVGEPRPKGRDHLELAGELIDLEAGAKLGGSRFAYLKGDLVFVELALVRWVLGKLESRRFTPVIPPVLAREQALFGTGFLPDTEQSIYHLPADDLYLVGTSEVAIATMHADEILDAETLPRRYAGFSPCFRREAGSAGKDTRGIFRVHQFDKVEMFSFVRPDESDSEHERILAIEEEILSELGIPYRVVNIAVDDLGASAVKKYDCEAWLPGQGRYRELTSTSNTTDFQARRLDIRYREAGGKPEFVHTLNGTAVAVGRTLIAILENGQRDDGSVEIPAVLQQFGAPAELRAFKQ